MDAGDCECCRDVRIFRFLPMHINLERNPSITKPSDPSLPDSNPPSGDPPPQANDKADHVETSPNPRAATRTKLTLPSKVKHIRKKLRHTSGRYLDIDMIGPRRLRPLISGKSASQQRRRCRTLINVLPISILANTDASRKRQSTLHLFRPLTHPF